MSTRPRIGLTSNFMHADPERPLFRGKTLQYLEERLALSLWRAGALPVMLPDLKDEDGRDAVMAELDGLVLPGGADVCPRSYGEEPLQEAWCGDPVRDAYEIDLITRALAIGLPVFGVCRGIQILNVALGGTLWQDLTTQLAGSLTHRDWHRYDELGHGLELEPRSWLASLYAATAQVHVNSVHHQGLRQVAPSLRPVAWAPDGVVEAVECIDDDRWLVGLQWHPEWLERERVTAVGVANGWADGSQAFAAFVQQCATRRASAR